VRLWVISTTNVMLPSSRLGPIRAAVSQTGAPGHHSLTTRYHGTVMALARRVLARLRRGERTSGAGLGLPCAVCGEAATAWCIRVQDHSDSQVIDGYAACPAHQTDAVGLPLTKAG